MSARKAGTKMTMKAAARDVANVQLPKIAMADSSSADSSLWHWWTNYGAELVVMPAARERWEPDCRGRMDKMDKVLAAALHGGVVAGFRFFSDYVVWVRRYTD